MTATGSASIFMASYDDVTSYSCH